DIRGYFNHINHEWLMKMIRQRIADPVISKLIGKWLKAGVMQKGVVVRNEEGTPQGRPLKNWHKKNSILLKTEIG
ncbi:MAG TPA: hypothetical protein VGL27_05805, partial [Negativicutes bacterium]